MGKGAGANCKARNRRERETYTNGAYAGIAYAEWGVEATPFENCNLR